MAQNIKIVNTDYKGLTTPTNILFGDTITIKKESSLALTSFGALFDWRVSSDKLENQKIVINYQQINETDGSFNIVLPTKSYYSHTTLLDNLVKAISINFSPMIYLTGQKFLDYNMFQGLSMDYQDTPAVGGAVEGLNAVLLLKKQLLRNFTLNHDLGDNLTLSSNIDENENPLGDNITLISYKGTGKRTMSSLKKVNALQSDGPPLGASLSSIGGMFVSLKGLTFRQDEGSFGRSSLAIVKKTSEGVVDESIAFIYDLTTGQGVNDLPEPTFSIEIYDNTGAVIQTIPIGDEFYNYKTEYQTDPTQPMSTLPFEKITMENSSSIIDRTLFFTQKDGYVVIGYYDPQTDTIYDFTQNQTSFKWDLNANYDFEYGHDLVRGGDDKWFNITFLFQGNEATLKPKSGGSEKEQINNEFTFSVDLTNAQVLMKSLGLEEKFKFRSIDGNLIYIPPFPIELFQTKQKEIALEIDTIKVKNFVGVPTDSLNKTQGRRNVIAYFTPTITKSQHVYSLDYTPNEPIYLKVDSNQDIDLTSLNYRLYYTFDNKPLQNSSVSFVLTNK